MHETTTRRPPGSGALHQTAPDLWRGRYVVTDPLTHERVRRYVSGHTRQEAGRRLRDAIVAAHRETVAADTPTRCRLLEGCLLECAVSSARVVDRTTTP